MFGAFTVSGVSNGPGSQMSSRTLAMSQHQCCLVRVVAKGDDETFLNLQSGHSVVSPVAPHLVVHGCNRSIACCHVLDLTGAQVPTGIDRFKGAFGVDADAGDSACCDFIDWNVRSKDANDLDLISGVQAFNEVSLLTIRAIASLAVPEVAEVVGLDVIRSFEPSCWSKSIPAEVAIQLIYHCRHQ